MRRELHVLRRRVRRRHDLDRVAARVAEFGQQAAHPAGVHAVAAGVRDDRLPAGRMDPADGLRQRRPFVRDVAGLAGRQVAGEDILHFACVAGFDEIAREMRPRDEPLARHVAHGAFVRAVDSRDGQAHRPMRRARVERPTRIAARPSASVAFAGSMPSATMWIVMPSHVDRELGPADQRDPCVERRRRCASARPLNSSWSVSASTSTPCARGARDDGRRRQQAVGVGRVAVEVVTGHRADIVAALHAGRSRQAEA